MTNKVLTCRSEAYGFPQEILDKPGICLCDYVPAEEALAERIKVAQQAPLPSHNEGEGAGALGQSVRIMRPSAAAEWRQ